MFDEPEPVVDESAKNTTASEEHQLWSLPLTAARQRMVERFERDYLRRLLEEHHSVAMVAREAQVDRVYMYRLLRKYGLKATK